MYRRCSHIIQYETNVKLTIKVVSPQNRIYDHYNNRERSLRWKLAHIYKMSCFGLILLTAACRVASQVFFMYDMLRQHSRNKKQTTLNVQSVHHFGVRSLSSCSSLFRYFSLSLEFESLVTENTPVLSISPLTCASGHVLRSFDSTMCFQMAGFASR